MSKERYWPQHKVFFIATLALFPEKLNGYAVNPWFYRPYFIAEELDVIKIELEDYKNAGYLKYKEVDGLYEISDIDSQRAVAKLTEYLEKWQHEELLSLPAGKPPDISYQQTLLLNAIARVYVSNQKEPRISLKDIYGESNEYSYAPPFWELVLSCQLLDRKVKIEYMDYDRQVDGLYDDNTQPLVDLKIVSKEFEQAIARAIPLAIDTTSTKKRARLTMPDSIIFAELDNSNLIQINERELRTDLAPYSLMKRLLEHPTIPVTLETARKLDGCEDIRNLSEVIRQCGFNEAKKNMFFEISTAKKVKLKKDIYLSPDDIALLSK